MQEEIIPLVPALLVLGAGLGIDAVAVVAMSAGAAMVGSAFGPTNPFQAGIALKLAQLPPLSGGGLRLAMFVAGYVLWTGWTMRYAQTQVRCRKVQCPGSAESAEPHGPPEGGHYDRLGRTTSHADPRARAGADGGVRVRRAQPRLGIQRAVGRLSGWRSGRGPRRRTWPGRDRRSSISKACRACCRRR